MTPAEKTREIRESLRLGGGRWAWWYPRKVAPVMWLGMTLGLLPWCHDGHWSFGVGFFSAAVSLLASTLYLAIYWSSPPLSHLLGYEMEYLSTTASVIAMICDLSCFKMMVVGAVFTLIWFRLKAQDVHCLLAACKELEVRQKVGRKIMFWPPLLLVLILTEVVLISTWYMEDLTFVSAPRWVVVVVMPIHAINRTTAVFPTLLYIGVTDVLKDYAAYLGGRLETAYKSRDLARTGSRTMMRHTGLIKMTRENDCGTSDGHLDVVVDEAAQELHQLLNLHHQLDTVVSIPLLVSLMGSAISIVAAAFFFSEAASFCEILTLMMTMMLTLTLLYVQGSIGDAFHQQLLNVHHVVRQLLNTGLSSHTDAAQDFLVSQVKQLSDEAGDPLEMTIGGLYTLSGSNFLPIVGAVVSNLVILLQFYLPCSNSHGSP